jgi:hypothetical protein
MAYPVPFYPSTVAQLIGRMTTLANNPDFQPFCRKFNCTPAQAHEGGALSFLQIGTGTGNGRPRILIVSGVHAREFAPPDALMTFVEKLLAAYHGNAAIIYDRFDDPRPQGTGTRYERFTIPYTIVQRIITRAELYVLPVANPDGRAFAQASQSNDMWRKNRAPAPPGSRTCAHAGDDRGVDINRNFDIGWDFRTYYSAAALASMAAPNSAESLGVSDDPCDFETFHGQGPAATRTREPETTAIINLLNSKNINFYMDVHSSAGHILFPWGLEQNQDQDPDQTFKNTSKDHQRDGLGTAYKEWMPPGTEARHRTLGTFINDAILDSTGFSAFDAANDPNTGQPRDATAERARRLSDFAPVQSPFLNGTSVADWEPGGSDDFAFSRQIGGPIGLGTVATALDPVVSFTFECGHDFDGAFHPLKFTQYPKVEREVGAGLAAFLANAAGWHSTIVTSGPPPPPASRSWCFIATAAYGSPLHPKVRYLCDVRDNEVKTTRFGKRFMDRWDRVYYSFSPQVADWLRRHERARTGVRLFGAEPWIAMVRVVRALTRRIGNDELRAASFLGLVSLGTLGTLGAVIFLLFLLGRFVAGLA